MRGFQSPRHTCYVPSSKVRSHFLRLRAHPVRIGMRFWLPLAFGLIAAVTALIVSWVFSGRSENALRASAEDLALASSLGAADNVADGVQRGNLAATLDAIATNRQAAVFVFNEDGKLISSTHSRGIRLTSIVPRAKAVRTAMGNGKYVSTIDHGHGTLVGLPVPRVGGVVPTYSPRPELESQVGIVHRQVVQAALFASLAGALAGLLVAMLIASRLRRIGHAADAIEGGNFDTRLHPWLKDELGGLAETIDRMRA